jgi:signal transduction histidine kinase
MKDSSNGNRFRAPLVRADNPLVRAIGRAPATVQRKLLVALALVAVLLVTVGVLGLLALSASNDRVATLGLLPQRDAIYGELRLDSEQLSEQLLHRDRLALPCTFGAPCNAADAALLADTDAAIETTLSAIGPLSDVAKLTFVPSPDQSSLLSKIHSDYLQISTVMPTLFAKDHAGKYSNNLPQEVEARDLASNANQLISVAESDAAGLIAQNQASYLDSQHLFIGVAVGSVVLALLLGLALSWSLTGPIRKMDTRLSAIAAGDFSGHVDVANRDELGALGTKLNHVNDELGRLYGELENASRHKSEFLANMSHELRTPLNAVIGFSEVLQDRLFGELNDKQAEYVTDIHTSGRHLLALINDILDLSKIEAGRMELQVTAFALSAVLENAVALARERATRQGISLGLEVDPSAGIVEADERKIKQVLFNLLTNALKFTVRGGHVDVTARGDDDHVVVSVRDDGIGIAQADQVRIFEEFQQVGTSQLQEGTGLGLALSRRFVELHGGRLWVESEPGQGSTFTFTLPRTQSARVGADGDSLASPDAAGVAVPTSAPL